MWSSTNNPSSQNLQHALVSAPELQALLHPARGDKGVPALMRQVHPAHAMWSVQTQNESVLNAQDNLILSALPPAELVALAPHLEPVTLISGQVITQPGHVMGHVYFPLACSVSWVSHTADGESTELSLVGSDGMVGVPLILGGLGMQHTLEVQCGGQALRMAVDVFMRMLSVQVRLHKLALLYAHWQMAQMAQNIVCSRHHAVAERLSHWLLCNAQAAKRAELHITHETISQRLGVRRETVTQAAGRLQSAGWIGNSRGKITLKNPDMLRRMACECQARSQAESQRYVQLLTRLATSRCGDDPPSTELQNEHRDWAAVSVTAARPDVLPELPPCDLSHSDVAQPRSGDDLQKYVDAYDFAPVGFVTLNAQGQILQTNLAGAIMLDIQRSQCQHQLFVDFLEGESQAPFARYHQEVLGGQCRHHCVVQLTAAAHRSAMRVRIDATADEWGVENRMVLIDVSEKFTQDAPQGPRWQFQQRTVGEPPAAWPS